LATKFHTNPTDLIDGTHTGFNPAATNDPLQPSDREIGGTGTGVPALTGADDICTGSSCHTCAATGCGDGDPMRINAVVVDNTVASVAVRHVGTGYATGDVIAFQLTHSNGAQYSETLFKLVYKACDQGQITWGTSDGGTTHHLYVCTGANTWKKTTLA